MWAADLEEIENQKECAHSQWIALSAWKIVGIIPQEVFPPQLCNSSNFFYADTDSGWLILGRTMCIPLSSQEKLFLAWLLTHADLRMEWMVPYSNARDSGTSWKDHLLNWTVSFFPLYLINLKPRSALPAVDAKWELQRSSSSGHSCWHMASRGWLTFMAWWVNILGPRHSGQGHGPHFARHASTGKNKSLPPEVYHLSRPNLS